MSIKEQFEGILKASPHLPFASLRLISILIGIPFFLVQFLNTITTSYTEIDAVFKGYTSVQERVREGKIEYFFKLNYSFRVNGKDYSLSKDNYYISREIAEFNLTQSQLGEYSGPISIWYKTNDPHETKFENPNVQWIGYLGLIVLLSALAFYFKWILLKFYELEIKA